MSQQLPAKARSARTHNVVGAWRLNIVVPGSCIWTLWATHRRHRRGAQYDKATAHCARRCLLFCQSPAEPDCRLLTRRVARSIAQLVAMASPFVRLNDDRAEETAIQQSGVAAAASIAAAVAQSQAEWEARRAGVLRVSGALIASILPLAIAYACGKLMPGAVSDAMAKSALASSTMMLCSFVGYGVSVPVRVLAGFQHLAAGLLISSVAVELVPIVMEAPADLSNTIGIVSGFIGGTAAFFALGAYCGAPEDDEEDNGGGAKAPSGASTPRGTPRGLTKLAYVQRAAEQVSPPYPGALVAAVIVDSAVDGIAIRSSLIGSNPQLHFSILPVLYLPGSPHLCASPHTSLRLPPSQAC